MAAVDAYTASHATPPVRLQQIIASLLKISFKPHFAELLHT